MLSCARPARRTQHRSRRSIGRPLLRKGGDIGFCFFGWMFAVSPHGGYGRFHLGGSNPIDSCFPSAAFSFRFGLNLNHLRNFPFECWPLAGPPTLTLGSRWHQMACPLRSKCRARSGINTRVTHERTTQCRQFLCVQSCGSCDSSVCIRMQ